VRQRREEEGPCECGLMAAVDHDLGLDIGARDRTGYDVLL
jgi:hypothetical protein